MQATALLQRQFASVQQILHDVADDLTPGELMTRVLPDTNLLAFDLWHVARTADWAVQTLVRGVPEIVDEPRWQGKGRLATHGIGVGMTRDEADSLASTLDLRDILAYADAVYGASLEWLGGLADAMLDSAPDVPAHLARYTVYLEAPMRAEVPWMFQNPPLWRCLNPAVGHNRDHLAEADLLKRQLRGR